MNAETERFLRDLFARCPVGLPAACVTLSAIHPDGDRPTPSRHVPLDDWPTLEQAVQQLMEANAQGWGAYVGIATRQRGLGRWARGGKNNLAILPALFADLDDPENALVRLGWFDRPASFILHSGHGYHAYWLLEQPTTDFGTAERAIHGLAQHLCGDEVLSAAQSMRLAGTLNTKPGRAGTVCTFVSYHPERQYQLAEFEQFMTKSVPFTYDHRGSERHSWPPNEERQPLIEAVADAVLNLLDRHYRSNGFIVANCPLPHLRDGPRMHFSYVESERVSRGQSTDRQLGLPKTTLEYLAYGAPPGTRNHALFVAACQFRDADFDITEAQAVLIPRYVADGLTTERESAREQEARATIRSAYRRPRRIRPSSGTRLSAAQ